MPQVLVKMKVKDFAKWKPVFDTGKEIRQGRGSKGGRVYRSTADPNQVVILFDWDTADKASQFFKSDILKQRLQQGGVMGGLDLTILEEVEKTEA